MTSFWLKILAIVTMAIDHTAHVLYQMGILQDWGLYFGLRTIGRIAFPIFAFLLAAGFQYTRNRGRYLGRLLLFGALSQPVFVWALFPQSAAEGNFVSNWCTLFTLALGLACIWLVNALRTRSWGVVTSVAVIEGGDGPTAVYRTNGKGGFWDARLLVGVFGAVGFLLQILGIWSTDYGWLGVLLIVTLSLLPREDMRYAAGAILVWGILQYWGNWLFIAAVLPAALAVLLYRGRQGKRLKWPFYLFYPVHLLLLGVVQWLLGTAG